MPKIVVENWSEKMLEAVDLTKPLLKHFHDQHVDWMHACGGKGRCTTCKVIVVDGADNFSSLTPAEQRYRRMGALRENERLACQVRIKGDIIIRVAEEYKLPHIKYDEGENH